MPCRHPGRPKADPGSRAEGKTQAAGMTPSFFPLPVGERWLAQRVGEGTRHCRASKTPTPPLSPTGEGASTHARDMFDPGSYPHWRTIPDRSCAEPVLGLAVGKTQAAGMTPSFFPLPVGERWPAKRVGEGRHPCEASKTPHPSPLPDGERELGRSFGTSDQPPRACATRPKSKGRPERGRPRLFCSEAAPEAARQLIAPSGMNWVSPEEPSMPSLSVTMKPLPAASMAKLSTLSST